MTTTTNPKPGLYRTLVAPAASLCWREIIRFYRFPSRVIGALGTPIVFWVLIGSGISSSFSRDGSDGGMDYLEYFFPGSLLLILLFTSIFTMMSVIEDRKEGFLLSALVAPIHRSALVLGKVFGGAILATTQGLVFLLAAPLAGVPVGLSDIPLVAVTVFLIAVALTGVGFLFAWRLESTQGFHAIINLFLMPLWFLSGALFPVGGASGWIQWLMKANPLTYANIALRQSLYGEPAAGAAFSFELALAVTAAFTMAVLIAAFITANRPLKVSLG